MGSVFISYSHADSKEQADLRRFLKPLEQKGLIAFWDDLKIRAGDDWRREIDRALAATRTAVLLITQNFLNSHFITDEELPYLLAKHGNKEITLLPVFLRPSNVRTVAPEISSLQGYGTPDQPLSKLGKTRREEIYVALSERLAELAEQPPYREADSADVGGTRNPNPDSTLVPATRPSPSPRPEYSESDSRGYALTIHLRREGGRLLADYRRPGEDPFLHREGAWSETEARIRPILNILDSGNPNRIAGLVANAADHWGQTLFEILFGGEDEDREKIFRHAFFQFTPEPRPNPVRAPLRLRIAGDLPELLGLPWRLTAWDGRLLREHRWTFLPGHEPDPIRDFSTHGPCEILLIGAEGHGAILRESLLSLWPRGKDYLRLAASGAQVENAVAGQRPHLVYVRAPVVVRRGEAELTLADGPLPLSRLADILNRQKPGPAVVFLDLDEGGAIDPAPLFSASIPLLLRRRVSSAPQDPTALSLAWLNAWLREGRDPVEALHHVGRAGSPVDAVEAQMLAVRAEYRHWHTELRAGGPREPLTLLRLDREKQKGLVAKWLGELIGSDRLRAMALTPYGVSGNRLPDLHRQLSEHASAVLDRRAAIKLIRLQFPESRANLRIDLEHELKQQLGLDEAGGESVKHLLQRRAPRYEADRHPVLWLHWGVFGGGQEPPLKASELGDWLDFTCEFLTGHCPDNLRIVAGLAIETERDKHPALLGYLTRKHRDLTDPRFWLRILDPVEQVADYELLDYLKDHSDGCPPQICSELAQLLILETRGEFEGLVRLIEAAEIQGAWHALLERLRRKHRPQPLDDDFSF